MLGLAYASVPLYRMFCQATGFGGTTQRAEAAPGRGSASSVSIRFDANTSGNLAWSFHPVQTAMTVKLGEQNMAHYRAVQHLGPDAHRHRRLQRDARSAGIYFNKIQCFCFTEQTLKPGESVDMPVVFFVDPDMIERSGRGEHQRNHLVLYVLSGGQAQDRAGSASRHPAPSRIEE